MIKINVALQFMLFALLKLAFLVPNFVFALEDDVVEKRVGSITVLKRNVYFTHVQENTWKGYDGRLYRLNCGYIYCDVYYEFRSQQLQYRANKRKRKRKKSYLEMFRPEFEVEGSAKTGSSTCGRDIPPAKCFSKRRRDGSRAFGPYMP